jgi:V/A-type H+/Na+-transporting ATPase subunit I
MRIDVKKYLFFGYKGALQEFFEEAQKIGLVHFIDSRKIKIKEIPQEIQNITQAIKIVRELPTMDQEEPEKMSEADALAAKILALKHNIEKLEEEKRMLQLEISRIDVFGDFSLEDVEILSGEAQRYIQFYFGKKGTAERELSDNVIYIASENGLDYFVAVNEQPTQYEQLVEMKIDQELGVLQNRLEAVELDIRHLEKSLKEYSKYDEFLHHALTVRYNSHELATAKKFAEEQMDGRLFAVEGWVPLNKIRELETHLTELDVHLSEVALGPGEEPPTYLENEGVSRVGEDLVHIYDTPANTDKDPSLWVLASFAVFFAMIINDAGYGLLFLAGALYFRFQRGELTRTANRVWKLMVILFTSCIAWGLLTNSFFGIPIDPESPIRRVSFLNELVEQKAEYHFEAKDEVYQDWVQKYPGLEKAADSHQFLVNAKKVSGVKASYEMVNKFSDGVLMELALLVGMIHITLSFLRYLRRNWAGIGWIIGIWGCYFYFPLFLGATSLVTYVFGADRAEIAKDGLIMIYAGLGLAVLLGVIQNKWLGLLEITNLIQVFADILSYLRLYALGLAGAIIGQTVNDIAGSLMYVPAVILIVIGHGLNMVLAIIGGVIHGLRLNFIEWYHYSFEGGGKLFTPLKKLEIE